MHKKKPHSKKPSIQSASASQPLKRGYDSAISAESVDAGAYACLRTVSYTVLIVLRFESSIIYPFCFCAAQSQLSPSKRGHDNATSAATFGAGAHAGGFELLHTVLFVLRFHFFDSLITDHLPILFLCSPIAIITEQAGP